MLCMGVTSALLEERKVALSENMLRDLLWTQVEVNAVLAQAFRSSLCTASFSPFLLLPLFHCTCPSPVVVVQFGPGLTVGDLQLCSSVGPLWCSAAPHQHGGTVRCSAANPLINLGPSITTVCLGHSQKKREQQQHLTHLQVKLTRIHFRSTTIKTK